MIIKEKRPKVKMLIGRVRIKMMGRKKTFTNPKTNETIKAVQNPSTWTPGNR